MVNSTLKKKAIDLTEMKYYIDLNIYPATNTKVLTWVCLHSFHKIKQKPISIQDKTNIKMISAWNIE